MSKEEIFRYFYTNSANLGVETILFTMLAGLLIAGIIYLTYYICYKGVAYNSKFNLSLVVILLISIVIMLMISSNIVISLGMVGALSIVRFRTAIKDSRDTVFIFWAIAEGLSVGSTNFKLALVTTLFISIVLCITSYIPNIFKRYIIVIQGKKDPINQDKLIEELKPVVLDYKLRTANRDEEHQEMVFEVRAKKELDLELINKLKQIEGVSSVNWILENQESVG